MDTKIVGIDLVGKRVVLDPKVFSRGVPVGQGFIFTCEGGFGCSPHTHGSAVFGKFEVDGEETRVERHDILRLATVEEKDFGKGQ